MNKIVQYIVIAKYRVAAVALLELKNYCLALTLRGNKKKMKLSSEAEATAQEPKFPSAGCTRPRIERPRNTLGQEDIRYQGSGVLLAVGATQGHHAHAAVRCAAKHSESQI